MFDSLPEARLLMLRSLFSKQKDRERYAARTICRGKDARGEKTLMMSDALRRLFTTHRCLRDADAKR